MLNKTPKTVVFPTAAQHSFDQGGQAMDIKHTHPQYPDEEQRIAALRDAQRLCLSLIREERKKEKVSADRNQRRSA